ncbi:PREDICTED: gustatory receptor for sugar taste 43a [Vollenhovia emeryi]|uniref:gustatory receptor for sugar taste 43a n=1 Tax=Vollenhovia emeryi TaxID=411798 RepID=UPI0005F4B694|nr:PREDICTED: gustatory receptor for sugar taste 43a [Vollenhovia emeryi]XP_011862328.1 PREDICTED: gustatory receptor for sugar taste 43a [Vollenhovia emeryi]XP_011862329.1 PREDICTED: gustatory receptor for sugar taste 43a [Vollenhovia emeryi]
MQLVNYFARAPTNIIDENILMSRKTHRRWGNFDKQQMTNRMSNKPTNVDEYDVNSDGVNNKSVNSDLYQALFPIYHLSKLSGVFPTRFVRQVSGRYHGRLSVTDSIYSVCLLICLIGAEIWGFWRDLRDGWEHSTRLKSQNAVIVTASDVIGVMSLTAASVIGSILCWKHIQTIIDKLVDCDEKLGIVSPKKIRRYTIFLTLSSLLYSIVLSCLDIYTWNYEVKLNKKLNDKGPINYVPLYFMYIVIMMMEVQYAVATYNVCQRFCRLNKNVENILKSDRITDQFRKDLGLASDFRDQGQLATNIRQDMENVRIFRKTKIMDSSITNDGKNFTHSIAQLMTVHGSLCDTVMLINAAYGVVTLVITITCLIHLIITPYFLIMEADGRREPLFLAVQGLWCIFHIWRLLMIVQPTYAAITQGKKTAVLVSQLLSMSPDREGRKQLEIFSLQLLHRPLEFSACGLFTLDRTLVTSIAGAVTTYLVILIQFQKDDDTKGNFNNILKNATQILKNASLHNPTAGKLDLN